MSKVTPIEQLQDWRLTVRKTLAWSPDGQQLAFTSSKNSIYIWDVYADEQAYRLGETGGEVIGLQIASIYCIGEIFRFGFQVF